MELQTLLLERRENVALVTVNRPDKLNALNALAKSELRRVFDSLESDEGVLAVVITGAGEKAFVAGTDIQELKGLDNVTGERFSREGQSVLDRIARFPKPVIAAVNGYALGGGCELALACHIRIASDKAKFGQPEVNLGILPGYGGTQRLTRLVGLGRALEMLLSGEPIDAAQAERIGLVNRVVPSADLIPSALALARTIASRGQVSVRYALEAALAVQELPLGEGQELEARLFGECCTTEDFREGIAAFLEKRKPNFRGT